MRTLPHSIYLLDYLQFYMLLIIYHQILTSTLTQNCETLFLVLLCHTDIITIYNNFYFFQVICIENTNYMN